LYPILTWVTLFSYKFNPARFKIYLKFYHCIIYIANEEVHVGNNRSLTIIFVYVVDVTSVNISPFDCDDNVFSSTCEELDRDAKAMFGTSICDNEELKSKCCICRNYGK
jgi:hypothetical protein